MKNSSLWEGLMLPKFIESCLPWEGPYTGAREGLLYLSIAETTHNELTITPLPHLPVSLVEEVELGRRDGKNVF